jgi:hypothetical protein
VAGTPSAARSVVAIHSISGFDVVADDVDQFLNVWAEDAAFMKR